jgi:hypothetical protein
VRVVLQLAPFTAHVHDLSERAAVFADVLRPQVVATGVAEAQVRALIGGAFEAGEASNQLGVEDQLTVPRSTLEEIVGLALRIAIAAQNVTAVIVVIAYPVVRRGRVLDMTTVFTDEETHRSSLISTTI